MAGDNNNFKDFFHIILQTYKWIHTQRNGNIAYMHIWTKIALLLYDMPAHITSRWKWSIEEDLYLRNNIYIDESNDKFVSLVWTGKAYTIRREKK